MRFIQPVTPATASPEMQAIFQEIKQGFGKVPNLFLTMAHHPPLLKANWEKVKAVMMGGNLPRRLKEAIALLVSQDNGCQYCVQAHSAALRSLKVSEETLALISQGNLAAAEFSLKEITLIHFAQAANKTPHAMPEALISSIQAQEISPAEVVEALGVMETFLAFNRFLDALAVEIDF
ncbi:MAG: peroxidase-related enzyme [Cyanobacteria bacterium P01_C01_bin.73]